MRTYQASCTRRYLSLKVTLRETGMKKPPRRAAMTSGASDGLERLSAIHARLGSGVGLVQALAAALSADRRELRVVDGDGDIVAGAVIGAVEVRATLRGVVSHV